MSWKPASTLTGLYSAFALIELGGLLVFRGLTGVFALQPGSGRTSWTLELAKDRQMGSKLLGGSGEVVVTWEDRGRDGVALGIDPRGKPIWRRKLPLEISGQGLVVSHGRVLLHGAAKRTTRPVELALDTGKVLLEVEAPPGDTLVAAGGRLTLQGYGELGSSEPGASRSGRSRLR